MRPQIAHRAREADAGHLKLDVRQDSRHDVAARGRDRRRRRLVRKHGYDIGDIGDIVALVLVGVLDHDVVIRDQLEAAGAIAVPVGDVVAVVAGHAVTLTIGIDEELVLVGERHGGVIRIASGIRIVDRVAGLCLNRSFELDTVGVHGSQQVRGDVARQEPCQHLAGATVGVVVAVATVGVDATDVGVAAVDARIVAPLPPLLISYLLIVRPPPVPLPCLIIAQGTAMSRPADAALDGDITSAT